ncbi:MAG TPA: hypothetical protein VMX16_10675 [Terriglobia bacterium]|nr:hypothetical protein [Terriglobia bacterium]
MSAQQAVSREIGYSQTHRERMRYAEFRRQGLFVGSEVMEAGCKTLAGLRLQDFSTGGDVGVGLALP